MGWGSSGERREGDGEGGREGERGKGGEGYGVEGDRECEIV